MESLDVKSLLLANAIITAFVGVALYLYRRSRKTYPGFGLWLAGNFVITAGYGALIVSALLPPVISLSLTNVLLVTGALLRLDGSRLFLQDKRITKPLYLLPFLVAFCIVAIHLHFGNRPPLRSLIVSTVVFLLILFNAYIFFRPKRDMVRGLASAIGYAMLLWAFLLIFRAVSWAQDPKAGIFSPTSYHLAYTLCTLILEIILSVGLFMLNGARLEEELLDSNRELELAVDDLRKSQGQLKILAGILPICMHCKKIKEEKSGSWRQLEDYISANSEAGFSHGICPDCLKAFYPDIAREEAAPVE